MGRSQKTLVGVDIGGSSIKAILAHGGKVVAVESVKTPKKTTALVQSVGGLVEKVTQKSKCQGVGLGIPGTFDEKRGVLRNKTNLKFLDGVKIQDLFRKVLKKPVRIENDANCFLLGEHFAGVAKNKKNVVGFTLGTGFGSAALIDGRLYKGAHGYAGELSGVVIDASRSNASTIEDFVSGHGFKRLGVSDPEQAYLKALKGDRKSKLAFLEIGKYFGIVLANTIRTLDPEVIIVGGEISGAGKFFMPQAKKTMRKYITLPASQLPVVKVSKLKHAGSLGAISLFYK